MKKIQLQKQPTNRRGLKTLSSITTSFIHFCKKTQRSLINSVDMIDW